MEYNIENNYYNPYRLNNKNNKQYKKIKVIIALLIIVLLISIAIFKKVYINKVKETKNSIEFQQESKQEIEQENKEPIIIDVTENEKKDEEKSKQDTPANTTPEKPTDKQPTEKPVEKPKEETTPKAPVGGKVGLDYFRDAVFIGDSRTEGFILNNGLASKTTSYTSKGLQVNTIFTDKVINMDGKKVTIIEALKNTSFSKVYIMLGINETGWVYNDLFIKKYKEIIDEIRKINPNCKIYVQSILPVSQKVSDEHKYIKNAKINEYNSLIEQMAKDKKVYYINVKEAVVNQYNVLPDDAATDGIHLNKKYCQKWLEYLTNHVV